MLNRLPMPPADALHGVMAKYAADKRSDKMDLGVGVYRDAKGASTIMKAVLAAEQVHISEQKSKSYMSLRGDEVFLSAMQSLAFGDEMQDRLASIQCVGGTGGIRLAINMAAKAKPDIKVLIGTPTWPNHFTICDMLGVETVAYPYFDKASQTLLFENVRKAASTAEAGDILILHGPCHNPTGADLSDAQLQEVLDIANGRGVIPLIDAAYYGLGADIDVDLKRLAQIVRSVPRAMVIMSCSKAFGLYRERTGVLFVSAENDKERLVVQKTLEGLGRATYSMPPAHGAAVVGRILSDEGLTKMWRDELVTMRERILGVRAALTKAAKGDPRIEHVMGQKGIFSLLPLSPEDVDYFAKDHAIYMPASGRINIAGFKTGDEARFCAALQSLSSECVSA